jgi:hypothetical protein
MENHNTHALPAPVVPIFIWPGYFIMLMRLTRHQYWSSSFSNKAVTIVFSRANCLSRELVNQWISSVSWTSFFPLIDFIPNQFGPTASFNT